MYKLQYDRPASINATGSYPLKIATRTDERLAIDLVVTMPKTLFQEKDYLNHRYFYKRSYYLACLAAGIKASEDHCFKLSFECMNGNHLQPIILVQPSGDGGIDDFSSSKCVICILLALPEHTLAENRLRPTSSCIRKKSTDNEFEDKAPSSTPFYNATLQSDASMTAYLKLLHATSSRCDAFKDACILGRIWMRQRGFSGRLRKGGFGNFEWAALMALLLQSPSGTSTAALSSGYSSYQMFKATLQFLAKHNLSKSPYTFQAQDIKFSKADLAPMLFDGPRNMNILYKMTPWSYARLQFEAKSTIEMLRESNFDQFESIFILKTDLLTYRYDARVDIPLSAFRLDLASDDYDQELSQRCRKIYEMLSRALTDRVTELTFLVPDQVSWDISSPKPPEDQERSIFINFATNPSAANRSVDHGPSAEEKEEAASFRKFWGDKAELRRFKDGGILESVVWSIKDSTTPVLEQIVCYILRRHLGAQVADEANFTIDRFAHIIPSGRIQGQSGISSFLARMNALASLEKDIRNLEGLPLQIRHMNAVDSQLRYSSIEVDSIRTPASLIVQFEGSARWPDDLCAIQRTKIAFLLKLSELLSMDKSNYVARVGLENSSHPSRNQAYLEIIMPSGYSFRLRIHHDREATLLERQLKDKSLDNQSQESAASALATYRRDNIHIAAHTQALQTLCTRYPALSPATRLMKQWFSSHLLSPHFSPELIELLVVRTFLQPHPWPIPSCATTGFLRTLMWISRWDWRHIPLIVDFSSNASANNTTLMEGVSTGYLGPEGIEKIQTRFEAWRRIDPAMNRVVIFAATNLDSDGTTWTDKARPEKVVAARMTALARAATNAIRVEEDRLLSRTSNQPSDPLAPESLFIPQLQDFDFLIRLSSKYTKLSKKKSEPKYKNLEIQQSALSTADKQSIDYNPVQLFTEDLQQLYGDSVLWFWDPDKPDVVAGLWNPGVTARRTWKVKVGWNSLPLQALKTRKDGDEEDDGVEIEVNKDAICNEIKRLGGEMVLGVELYK